MNIFIRYTVLVLVAAATVQYFVSCEQPDKESVSESSDTSVKTEAIVTSPPVFKESDLGGNEFTFLTYNEHATDYTDSYIWSDSTEGDSIGKAVFKRNSDTENMFNVKITADEVHSPKSEAMSRMQSGQCDFDVIYEWGTRTSSMALDGLLYDFKSLESVDLDRGYWIPSAKDDLTVSGKMYIATNYITMNSVGWANFLYFNQTMYDELGHTESLYDLVDERQWTFDRYVDLAVSASKDLNGDGIMTSADRYGIWGDINSCLTGLTQSAGIKNTVKNEDGSYSLSLYNESVVSIYTEFKDKLDNSNTFITYEQIWQEKPNLTKFESRHKGARFLGFGEGHVLFMPGTLNMIHEFEDMQDDYGILPNPLYTSDQTNYYHFVDTNAPMFSLPAEGDDLETTGMILEYMAYRSEEYLLPAFCESTIESKKNPDANDYRMFNIIKNSIKYEWTQLYELEVTNSIMSKMMVSGSFKSVYNRLCSKAKAEINGCVNTIVFMGLE